MLVKGRTAIDGFKLDDPPESAWTMLPSKSTDIGVERRKRRAGCRMTLTTPPPLLGRCREAKPISARN
jgi:hypothetical protein